ncbi:hypothetical protein EON83_29935 [bacterium]|nr:MAG: hypothetical protein EON83_29935 [bacterium]
MPHPTSLKRVFASVAAVLVLVTVASFLHALAIGLWFGTESFSNLVIAIDLVSRWFIFAVTAYIGSGIARERYSAVAVVGSALALLFCIAIMYKDKQPTTIYNYVSLFVLVSAICIGSLARGRQSIRTSSDPSACRQGLHSYPNESP